MYKNVFDSFECKELIKIVNKPYTGYTSSSNDCSKEAKEGMMPPGKILDESYECRPFLGTETRNNSRQQKHLQQKENGFQILIVFLKSYLYRVVSDPTQLLLPTSFCM
jgi:hypothetical protein